MTLQIYNYSLIGLSNKEPVMTPLKQRMHIVLCNTMFYVRVVWSLAFLYWIDAYDPVTARDFHICSVIMTTSCII